VPYVIPLFAAAAGLYIGVKWLRRIASGQSDSGQKKSSTPKNMGALEFDEVTRAYRPKS